MSTPVIPEIVIDDATSVESNDVTSTISASSMTEEETSYLLQDGGHDLERDVTDTLDDRFDWKFIKVWGNRTHTYEKSESSLDSEY